MYTINKRLELRSQIEARIAQLESELRLLVDMYNIKHKALQSEIDETNALLEAFETNLVLDTMQHVNKPTATDELDFFATHAKLMKIDLDSRNPILEMSKLFRRKESDTEKA